MNQKTKNLKNLILAVSASLGLAAAAHAQDPLKSPPNPGEPAPQGLLGSTYAGVAWNYYKLNDGPPSAARGLTAYFNQALRENFDLGVNYDWLRTRAAGFSTTEQKLGLSLTNFNRTEWGKVYLGGGVDYSWRRGDVTGRRGSWGLGAETGVEIQAMQMLAVTPFIGWDRETNFNRSDLRYGVRSTVRVSRLLSVTGTAQWMDVKRDVDRMGYSLGMNYHF